ncbi:sugar isomerase [Maribacter sp. 2-571]|uniref:sugar isomerase n=1 Tax=Maribacter sp. 2-571 TaxID=3417569 RepID=UPI003D34CB76
MINTIRLNLQKVSPEQLFMASIILVNGGNYIYNLLLGRILGPSAFAEAALLITLLLVLSFVGMTFQLATAKFSVLFSGEQWERFRNGMYSKASLFGLITGALVAVFSKTLQETFHTQNAYMFVLFGLGIPLYFFMSVNRGSFQGKQSFKKLSLTYQAEMWSRLLITLALLYLVPLHPGTLVAIGILASFFFGLFPSDTKGLAWKTNQLINEDQKRVNRFMLLTAGYELTQIIINNSDVLLVKHFFEAKEAGLYASLALIGRVVYFAAWMFVMLLLPKVVERQKEGRPTAPILFKYVSYIGVLCMAIVAACSLFPQLIISLMFGEAYIDMAPLLWQYALATSLFAISNIFAYYFLSLDHYIPVILSGILGISQIGLILWFHESLQLVVQVQIMAMIALLACQLLYFFIKKDSGTPLLPKS